MELLKFKKAVLMKTNQLFTLFQVIFLKQPKVNSVLKAVQFFFPPIGYVDKQEEINGNQERRSRGAS